MSDSPLISVVMGCYNSSTYIREAIDSILCQTIPDFEFIIIDDCSTDNTVDIIQSYQDKRIKLVVNKENKGLGYSLNLGVSLSRGRYIARMDSDDVSMPHRFERQICYFKKKPNTLVLGSAVKSIGKRSLYSYLFKSPYCFKPSDKKAINTITLFGAAFYHPSVMFNGEMMRQKGYNYNPDYTKAQDYELWSRIVWDNDVNNLDEALVCYRRSMNQASVAQRDVQLINSEKIYKGVFEHVLRINCCDNQIKAYRKIISSSKMTEEEYENAKIVLDKMFERIKSFGHLFDVNLFLFYMQRWTIIYCRLNLPLYKRFSFYKKQNLGYPQKMSDLIKLYRDF